jgi:hypothetical protein
MTMKTHDIASVCTVMEFKRATLYSNTKDGTQIDYIDDQGEVILTVFYDAGPQKPHDLHGVVPDAIGVRITGGVAIFTKTRTPQQHAGHRQTSANPAFQSMPVDPMVKKMSLEFAAMKREMKRLAAAPADRKPRQAVNRANQQVENSVEKPKETPVEVKEVIASDTIEDLKADEPKGEKPKGPKADA